MYVIERRPGGYAILHDISAKEFRESKAKWEGEGFTFEHVSAPRAHQWVKRGDIHSTDLWLDNGRIRKAGIGC